MHRMNVGGSLVEHVTNVLLLLPSFAAGSRLSDGATRQHAALVNTRYNELVTDAQSTRERLLSPVGQSSSDNIDISDKSSTNLPSLVPSLDRDSMPDAGQLEGTGDGPVQDIYDMDLVQPEDQNHFQSPLSNLLDWIRTLPTSNLGGQSSGSRDSAEDNKFVATGSADSTDMGAMPWLDDINDQVAQEQGAIGSNSRNGLSLLARSKRAVHAISSSSLSESSHSDNPAESNQAHDTFAKEIRNLTHAAADSLGETLQKTFSSIITTKDKLSSSFLPNGIVSASLTNSTHLANGDWPPNGDIIDLSQPESSFQNSHSIGSVTSSAYDNDDITSFHDVITSEMSTPFPGFINLSNISFEDANLNGLYKGGIVDHYLGNFSLDCFDWALNGSCLYGNSSTSNLTNVSAMDSVQAPPIRLWTLFLLIFPLLTVFGNILVVLSVFKERTLRTVTNYFIVSLAIADIMVAVLVMPLGVYVEVFNQHWTLGDAVCDTWVALDVMCCTASILNLTAISVDRFIAVTQPIKYARHKNSNRVWVMLVLTWVVSIAISSPIALGMNYTERRDPNMCVFYNSDFLIYSSMGSFYIPCLIMVLLYWRIFRAIRMRAKKQAKKNRPPPTALTVIENTNQMGRTTGTSDASATEDCHKELLPAKNAATNARSLIRSPIAEETSFTNYNAKLHTTTENSGEESSHSQSQSQGESGPNRGPISDDDEAHVIPNDKSADFMLSATSDDNGTATNHRVRDVDSGYAAPSRVIVEAHTSVDLTSPLTQKTLLSPPPRRPVMTSGVGVKQQSLGKRLKRNNNKNSPNKSVTKFNFHIHRVHSRKKKETNRTCASRRERKATKTLAIVLGVFLLCWVPFFTVNIMNAICIRFDLFDRPVCNIDGMLFSFFVWLGYFNSFLNPVIYTIFNIEFRRAFKKLLKQPCK